MIGLVNDKEGFDWNILYILLGAGTLHLFAGPFMQSVIQFSNALQIPFLFTSFVVAPFFMNARSMKRKREENLKNWKWEDVIVIDDVDVPNKVAETDNNAEVKEEHVTLDVPNQRDVENDDDVPPAPIKRIADEDEYNDEVADEDEVDDEDEWP
nr:EF-hand domain pair [Tanacetum cinerariifolium]